MSLFRSLFGLFPTHAVALEDFHTEVVAFVLQRLPDATLGWLKEIGATKLSSIDDLVVSTQEELTALDTHATGSRPDIAVRLSKDSDREIIFIESKVGAKEGALQLQRYSEHLARRDERRKTLIFITRSYEPKELPRNESVNFIQTRWAVFHRFFAQSSLPQRSDVLEQLLQFMEDHQMAQSNKFTSIDILALGNFNRARKLMDATLWESVHKKFTDVCGGKYFWKESAFTQLRNHSRYVMWTGYGRGYQFETLLGYWLDQDVVTDSPWVGVTYHVNPKAPRRGAIVSAFERYAKAHPEWKTFDLTNEKIWGGMSQGRYLEEFFREEDHVAAITRFFEELLDEVATFKKQHPNLPWKVEDPAEQKQS